MTWPNLSKTSLRSGEAACWIVGRQDWLQLGPCLNHSVHQHIDPLSPAPLMALNRCLIGTGQVPKQCLEILGLIGVGKALICQVAHQLNGNPCLFRHVLVSFTSHQGSKFCLLSPPQKASRLLVVKRLRADTARTADPY